jgi:anaerobic nitric oxide reductase transcription regulator
LLLAPGAEITAADLFGNVVAADAPPVPAPANAAAAPLSFREAKEQVVQNFERDFLLQALRRHGGNISKAAEEIGMYRQNFQQKMRELGINAEEAKDGPES